MQRRTQAQTLIRRGMIRGHHRAARVAYCCLAWLCRSVRRMCQACRVCLSLSCWRPYEPLSVLGCPIARQFRTCGAGQCSAARRGATMLRCSTVQYCTMLCSMLNACAYPRACTCHIVCVWMFVYVVQPDALESKTPRPLLIAGLMGLAAGFSRSSFGTVGRLLELSSSSSSSPLVDDSVPLPDSPLQRCPSNQPLGKSHIERHSGTWEQDMGTGHGARAQC